MKLVFQAKHDWTTIPGEGYYVTGSSIMVFVGTKGDILLSPSMRWYINDIPEPKPKEVADNGKEEK